jgi:hypothetical protein
LWSDFASIWINEPDGVMMKTNPDSVAWLVCDVQIPSHAATTMMGCVFQAERRA